MKKRLLLIVCVLAVVFILTGCTKGNNPVLPILKKGNGFFTFILIKPISYILNFFSFGNYYAVGIIITALIVRTALWPVYTKSSSLGFQMQIAQPELSRLQAKYATRQDPVSQQKMQREMMAIWKRYKINPLGCIPTTIIQMTVMIGMYNAVQRYPIQSATVNGEEVFSMFTKVWQNNGPGPLNTNFLGLDLARGVGFKDLTIFSNWAYLILPLLVAVTMFISTIISQRKPKYIKAYPNQPQNSQSQQSEKMVKIMMYSMTAVMFIMSMQSGTVALYWVIGNINTIVQTLIVKKVNEKKYLNARESSNIIG